MESNKRLENSKTKNYVLGFVFNEDGSKIALIEKKKPDFQKGFLNGIGGKIEEGESPILAMIREFKEEAGIDTGEVEWILFSIMHCKFRTKKELGKVWNYKIFLKDSVFNKIDSLEEEEIYFFYPREILSFKKLMNNLRFLIPMALDENFIYGMLNLSYE